KSGSGKSTLMHLLALLDEPTSGVVAMRGKVVSDLRPKEVAKVRNTTFGFVFQQFYLNSQETVLDNVTLPLKIAKVAKAERNRRSTRLNSSHVSISYAVFCLKKKRQDLLEPVYR